MKKLLIILVACLSILISCEKESCEVFIDRDVVRNSVEVVHHFTVVGAINPRWSCTKVRDSGIEIQVFEAEFVDFIVPHNTTVNCLIVAFESDNNCEVETFTLVNDNCQ